LGVAMMSTDVTSAAGSGPRRGAGRRVASRRLEREWRTIQAMVRLYCRAHHAGGRELCAECQGLLAYAAVRLERCRFGAEKPTCARCPVHCYQPARREQVRAVMRYAGPRMVWRHPVLSWWHWVDGLKRPAGGGRRGRG